jgi:hypothetical protein
VSAVVSAVVSGVIGFVCSWIIQRRAEWNHIADRLDDVGRTAIEYPYLEDDAFCAGWSPTTRDDRYLRYSSYCCLVFNVLERAWRHYGGNRAQIEARVGIRELVERHQCWWKRPDSPTDKVRGYEEGFRRFVGGYLKER